MVSLTIPLDVPDYYQTEVSCRDTYDQMIKHMIEKHNSKSFAFISGDVNKSVEAVDRLEAFKNGLKNNGINFDDSLLYSGEFTYDTAYADLKKKIHSKEDVRFDTVFAANDTMALACIAYLDELGLKVPDDVKVIGYDDLPEAATSKPSLSTINQRIDLQAQCAARMAEDIINGRNIEHKASISVQPIYRQSCGCVECTPSPVFDFADANDDKHNDYFQLEWALNRVYNLLDNTLSEETIQNLFNKIPDILKWNEINLFSICLFDLPVYVYPGEVIELPETARMVYFEDLINSRLEKNCNVEFSLNEHFIPDGYITGNGRQ